MAILRTYPKTLLISLLASISMHVAGLMLVIGVLRAPARHSELAYIDFEIKPPVHTVEPKEAPRQEPQQSAATPENPPPVQTPAAPQPSAANQPQIQHEIGASKLGLGMMYGYVNSLAEGVSLRDEVRDYYFQLVERINEAWWKSAREGLSETISNDGIVEIVIARDGSLLGSRIRNSTGSRAADRLLIKSIEAAAPLPSLPSGYQYDVFSAPLKIVRPSNLFRVEKK